MNIPSINKKYFCIVNYSSPDLAALISSELNEPNSYLPMFEFPIVSKEFSEVYDFDEFTLGRQRAQNLSIRLSNYLKLIGDVEYLILAGLTEEQLSYLYFKDDYNTILVDSIEEVATFVRPLNENKKQILKIKQKDILTSIAVATHTTFSVEISDESEELEKWQPTGNGLVIIENTEWISKIIAINYAVSINAEIEIIDASSEEEIREIKNLIIEWKENKSNPSPKIYNNISALIFPKIENLHLDKYDFVTFCTNGVPYSLITKNNIPSTYIALNENSDFFIINNLLSIQSESIGSVITFSPGEFSNEETDFLLKYFKSNKFYNKELINEDATVYNLDMGIRMFPYDILHICSHGGEIEGYRLEKKFEDAEGITHKIEYDEVLSFAPSKREVKIKLEAQQIWRYFNGDVWKSEAMNSRNYHNNVFAKMIEAVQSEKKGKYKGEPNDVIPISQHIKCKTFNYLAMFNTICDSKCYPLIFNNTCYSAQNIQSSFIQSGAKGYIGALWNVDNNNAVKFAETFYTNAFKNSLLSTFKKCCDNLKGTDDQDIYIYFGLPFTNIRKPKNTSKMKIANMLFDSHYRWKQYSEGKVDKKTKEEAERLSNWAYQELSENFEKEAIEILSKAKTTASKS